MFHSYPGSRYRNEAVPLEFAQLKIRYVHYLNLSHCRVSNSLYSQLAFTCPVLFCCFKIVKRFLSKLIVSRFKGNKHFKLLNVTYNKAALFASCIIELLKYNNNIECSWIFRDTI